MSRAIPSFVFMVSCLTLAGQPAVEQFSAEVPDAFGSVPGRVLLAGDQLVFASDTKPNSSFTVARQDIQSVTNDGDVVTIQLRMPIRDASGERMRVTLRVMNQAATASISGWFNRAASAASATQPVPASDNTRPADSATDRIYQAHHKKVFGGSKGRLLLTNSGLAYESIDDVSDSRRWQFQDIKELKLHNPYELEVDPFNGDKYTFGIDGQGFSSADYQQLVDRVTKARVAPQK